METSPVDWSTACYTVTEILESYINFENNYYLDIVNLLCLSLLQAIKLIYLGMFDCLKKIDCIFTINFDLEY